MEPGTILTLGARNLGGAILDHHLDRGWRGAAAFQDRPGGVALIGTAAPGAPPPQSGGPWGGGPIADGTMDAVRGWTVAVAEQCFAFLSTGARALRAQGRGGTLIQVTGGSSRRAMANRGMWAAGAFATRAPTQAAAQELRSEGIHVALLIVDATIESPKTAQMTAGRPREELADMARIAEAVEFLAGQDLRAYTHELVLTPAGDQWVP